MGGLSSNVLLELRQPVHVAVSSVANVQRLTTQMPERLFVPLVTKKRSQVVDAG
jgi:hypothetical protein